VNTFYAITFGSIQKYDIIQHFINSHKVG